MRLSESFVYQDRDRRRKGCESPYASRNAAAIVTAMCPKGDAGHIGQQDERPEPSVPNVKQTFDCFRA